MNYSPQKIALNTCSYFTAKWCHNIPLGKDKDYTVSTNCSKKLLKIRRLLISSPWDSHPLIKSWLLLVVVEVEGRTDIQTPLHEKVNKYVFTSWSCSVNDFSVHDRFYLCIWSLKQELETIQEYLCSIYLWLPRVLKTV